MANCAYAWDANLCFKIFVNFLIAKKTHFPRFARGTNVFSYATDLTFDSNLQIDSTFRFKATTGIYYEKSRKYYYVSVKLLNNGMF